jgi:hypothetical protein
VLENIFCVPAGSGSGIRSGFSGCSLRKCCIFSFLFTCIKRNIRDSGRGNRKDRKYTGIQKLTQNKSGNRIGSIGSPDINGGQSRVCSNFPRLLQASPGCRWDLQVAASGRYHGDRILHGIAGRPVPTNIRHARYRFIPSGPDRKSE